MHSRNRISYPGKSGIVTFTFCLLLAGQVVPAWTQDNVSIPKSRLEELEKKEAELEKLRNQLNQKKPTKPATAVAKGTNAPTAMAPVTSIASNAPAAALVPEPVATSPALATLPPLGAEEMVSAIDLASQYQEDRTGADRRYLKKSFSVQGEIERFEKRLFGRHYSIIMKSGGSNLKVVCEVFPPEPYTATYTANHGTEIVGMYGDQKKTLARADAIAVVRGECAGVEGSLILLKACALKSVRSTQ
jgi:hypothetical protein